MAKTATKKSVKKDATVKHYKRIGTLVKSENFIPFGNADALIEKIKNKKEDALIRDGDFSRVIVWDKVAFNFSKTEKNSSFRKSVYLFGVVRKEAKMWLKKNPKFKLPTQYPVNVYNEHYKHLNAEMTATDLDHAYWRIAYLLGIITPATYERALDSEFKVVRLASLSTLGAGKEFRKIEEGVLTDKYVKVGETPELQKVYKLIRYTCYDYMQQCANLLGEDFIAYRTDAIYYRDSAENRKLVRDFFKKNKLKYKQVYNKSKARFHKEPSQTKGDKKLEKVTKPTKLTNN
jgi:hypothetical protein